MADDMRYRWRRLVGRDRTLTEMQLRVALAVDDAADADGSNSRDGAPRIACENGYTRARVTNALAVLVSRGYLVKTGTYGGKQVSVYRLTVPPGRVARDHSDCPPDGPCLPHADRTRRTNVGVTSGGDSETNVGVPSGEHSETNVAVPSGEHSETNVAVPSGSTVAVPSGSTVGVPSGGHTTRPRPDPDQRGGCVPAVGHQDTTDVPPALGCSRHPDGTDAPCRGCGDARRRREQWQAGRDGDDLAARRRARTERDACTFCDPSGYRIEPPALRDLDLRVIRCDHHPITDTEHQRRASRGGLPGA